MEVAFIFRVPIRIEILPMRILKIVSPLKNWDHVMWALRKTDLLSHPAALYKNSLNIIHFALTRHQARNLKIRIHGMNDNTNAVILVSKVKISDHPLDYRNFPQNYRLATIYSSWRETARMVIGRGLSIYHNLSW